MQNNPTAEDFRKLLKRHGVRLNTLHAALRIPYLDEPKGQYFRDRDEDIVKFVAMLGGIRLPDLWRIIQLTQPTTWRIVERLRMEGKLRVEQGYRDHVAGARAKWIQPAGSVDLSDTDRARLIETAQLIRDYKPLWSIEEYRARVQKQAQEQGW